VGAERQSYRYLECIGGTHFYLVMAKDMPISSLCSNALISIVVKRLAAPVPVHESGSERLRVEVEFPCDYREFHSAVTH